MPTIVASNKCMAIAQREYGSKHHLSNPANAFRHALWVNLIIRRCRRWKDDEARATKWAKKFTDWHEDFAPNKKLDRAMDLHNNKMGILFYQEIKNCPEEKVISFLKEKAKESKQIYSVTDTEKYPKTLVYVSK